MQTYMHDHNNKVITDIRIINLIAILKNQKLCVFTITNWVSISDRTLKSWPPSRLTISLQSLLQ